MPPAGEMPAGEMPAGVPEEMTVVRSWHFWLAGALVFFAFLYLLRGILLPFVAGMAIAYILDPVCDRLERAGCSRTFATAFVTAFFVLTVIVLLLFAIPFLGQQLGDFLTSLPDYAHRLEARLRPYLATLMARYDLSGGVDLAEMAKGRLGGALGWLGDTLRGVLAQGAALANLLSLVFITPVVTFYLLRDWDLLLKRADSLLPRGHAAVIRAQFAAIDAALSGFARGQSLVCCSMAVYYGIALQIAGLPFGLVVGVMTGLLAFVPYVGASLGALTALTIACAQFDTWPPVFAIVAIFVAGQVVENNFLTPKLVGDRVGLHPVWIIFALLAGGSLFGFLGLLLAVPMAAAAGVLVRFATARYQLSPLYLGHGGKDGGAGGSL